METQNRIIEGDMTEEKRDSFWAYTFMFFLGGLGVHKFYVKKPFMGFMYMFTFGLFGFGYLYDLFTIPKQVREANEEIVHHESQEQKKCSCPCSS